MINEYKRVFGYSLDFYLKKVAMLAFFAIPFVIAVIIALLVSNQTYLASGAPFLRTESLSELSITDIIVAVAAYVIIMFIISSTIVNINIIVRSRRTLTDTTTEMINAMKSHAIRIFYISTLAVLIMFIIQLVTYDLPFRTWIYPILMLVFFFFISFSFPAVVIDNASTGSALEYSVRFALSKPLMVIAWMLTGVILLLVVMIIAYLLFPSPYWQYLVMLLNSIIILPFLLVLQTQMYMEKYPLAR